jgi:CHAD domain-containing protein
MPTLRRVRRNPEDLDRQGAEVRPARAGARGRFVVTAGRKSGWPPHCRAALARALRLASRQFPRAGEDEATRVHDVRKTLKGAAGLARLFTDLVGAPAEATLAAINAARRKVGRARDLDILPGVIASLDLPPESRGALIAAIAEQREAERRAHSDIDVGGLAAELRALADSVEAWDVEAAGATPLIAALRRTYRSARRRGDAALPGGPPRELHALRVRVVDLVHQLGVFEPAWPAMICATTRELQRLRTALGDHNDLSVLAEFAAARPELTPEQKVAVAVLIAKRRRPLARRAAQLYARLFAERPSAFERRLAATIENPRRKPPAHKAPRAPRLTAAADAPAPGRDGATPHIP